MKIAQFLLMMNLLVFVGSRIVSAAPIMIQNESGEETAELHFFMNKNGTGTVIVLPCPSCMNYTLKVTAQSSAFRNHKPVPMKSVSSIEKNAAIFYDIESKSVNRVYLGGDDN